MKFESIKREIDKCDEILRYPFLKNIEKETIKIYKKSLLDDAMGVVYGS